MNHVNEKRAQIVAKQLNLTSNDVTPTTNFVIKPEYTLIARLPEHINDAIYAVVNTLQKHFPEQYYYTPRQFHLTIVPIPHNLRPAQIIASTAPLLANWHLPIHARGVIANRLQAGAVLYPEEETLVPQRMKLRAALGTSKQAYTAHSPIWEELLWANFMRFTVKPKQELLEVLRANSSKDFGSFVLSRYELYEVSTKTLDPKSSKLLYTFEA